VGRWVLVGDSGDKATLSLLKLHLWFGKNYPAPGTDNEQLNLAEWENCFILNNMHEQWKYKNVWAHQGVKLSKDNTHREF
jgi:hypothetical protein